MILFYFSIRILFASYSYDTLYAKEWTAVGKCTWHNCSSQQTIQINNKYDKVKWAYVYWSHSTSVKWKV